MGFTIVGTEACEKFLQALQVERDSFNGDRRKLHNDKVILDSQKAWDGTSDHNCDGSTLTVVYKAYRKATKKQKQQAQGAKNAGVDLRLANGRLVDLKGNDDGTTLVLHTNGLRFNDDKIPFRSMNAQKGCVYAIAVDEALGMSADDAVTAAAAADAKVGVNSGPAPKTPPANPVAAAPPAKKDAVADQFDDIGDLEVPTTEEYDAATEKLTKEIEEGTSGTVKVKAGPGEEVSEDTMKELTKNLGKLGEALADGGALEKKITKAVNAAVHKEVKRQLTVVVHGLQDIISNMKDPNGPMPELPAEALAQLGGFRPDDSSDVVEEDE
jgi:hypothetical protein